MTSQPEARIIARQTADGRTEISVYEPERSREHRTGWTEGQATAEAKIRELKDKLESRGHHVTVTEISR